MAFNPFIELDDNEISNLAFDYTRHPYIYYSDTYGKQLEEVFSIEKKTFRQIQKLFNGDALIRVKAKDKVYICPGCKLPQFRIKEHLKTIKAFMTRDIEKATIIISTDAMCDEVDNGYRANKQARTNKLYFIDDGMFSIKKYDPSSDHEESETDYYIKVLEDIHFNHERLTDENVPKLLLSANTLDNISWNNTLIRREEIDETEYYLYPITLKIIYEILSKKIPVIHENTFCEDANSGLKLNDQNVFESIKMMLNGTNEDRNLAVEMVCNSDFSNSENELYYLASNHSNIAYRNRSKNLEYFLEESKFHMFASMGEYQFIEYMKENDKLTKELFNKHFKNFIDECLNGLNHHSFHDMFNVRISLKDEWIKFCDKKEKDNSYELDKNEEE